MEKNITKKEEVITEQKSSEMYEELGPIDEIFNEREDFILIGFTGRTGSGCTSAAKILETSMFEKLKIHEPKRIDFKNSEERKYEIIYDYAKYHWSPFKTISMTSVIFSFIIQKDFDFLIDLIKKELSIDDNFAKALENYKIDNVAFKDYFYNLNGKIMECIDDEDLLKRPSCSENIADIQIECLEKIDQVRLALKNCLSGKNCHPKKDTTINISAYTYFLQTIGNNLRISGKVDSDSFSGRHMSILARRANGFVKAYRSYNRKNHEKTLLCIDAIRNPYEATYFQDRYNAFYLVSINTDDDERKRRLRINLRLSDDQIDNLDLRESPRKLKGNDVFTCIDISACCELGDIHINNPYDRSLEKYQLSEQLVKYITLMKHPGLVTPSAIERCMQIAYNAKLNSGCLSRQVGAVITDSSFSVKAVGWNSVPEYQVPCNLRSLNNYVNNMDENAFSAFEIQDFNFKIALKSKYERIVNNMSKDKEKFDLIKAMGGRHFPYCFKDEYQKSNQVHTRSLHAEENAFLQLAKYGGFGIKGGNLFTTASSCVLCSKKAYHLGIKNIYYITQYSDIAESHIISFGKKDNENNPKNILFSGAIGRAYTCLYTQRIAIKDELEHMTSGYNTAPDNSIPISKLHGIIGLFENNKTDDAWKELKSLTKLHYTDFCESPDDSSPRGKDIDK